MCIRVYLFIHIWACVDYKYPNNNFKTPQFLSLGITKNVVLLGKRAAHIRFWKHPLPVSKPLTKLSNLLIYQFMYSVLFFP